MSIVQRDGWIVLNEKNELSAIPVTTPGRAIGSTSRKVMASRPKKRKRETAAATAVPRTSATAVARPAALSESRSASRAVHTPRPNRVARASIYSASNAPSRLASAR